LQQNKLIQTFVGETYWEREINNFKLKIFEFISSIGRIVFQEWALIACLIDWLINYLCLIHLMIPNQQIKSRILNLDYFKKSILYLYIFFIIVIEWKNNKKEEKNIDMYLIRSSWWVSQMKIINFLLCKIIN